MFAPVSADAAEHAPRPQAPIAQLDRASGYEPGGRTFESCWAHHLPSEGGLPQHFSVTPRLAFGSPRTGASRAGRTKFASLKVKGQKAKVEGEVQRALAPRLPR